MKIGLAVFTSLFLSACGGTDQSVPPPLNTVTPTKPEPLEIRTPESERIETRRPSYFDFRNRDLVFGRHLKIGQSYLSRGFGFDCYVGDEVTEVAPKYPFFRLEGTFDSRSRIFRLRVYGIQIAKTVVLKAMRLREQYATLEGLRESQRRERCGRSVVEQIFFGDSIMYSAEYFVRSKNRSTDFQKTFGDSSQEIDNLRKAVEGINKTFKRKQIFVDKNRDDLAVDGEGRDIVQSIVNYLEVAAEIPQAEDKLDLIKLVHIGIAPAYP